MVPRIVIVSPYLTTPAPDNAGLGYLNAVVQTLRSASVTVVVPDTPANRAAADRIDAPPHILIPIVAPKGPAVVRSVRAMFERMTPVRPPNGFLDGIRDDAVARGALERADVIDLQWPECSALVARMKRLAPTARRVVTLHDVSSQRFTRELRRARSIPRVTRLLSSLIHARIVERRVARTADTVVVFSEKDRALLPPAARSQVVHPPLAGVDSAATRTDAAPDLAGSSIALFVGPLRRRENRDGLDWFTTDVWPLVRRAEPAARLLVAGSRPTTETAQVETAHGVEMLGFVDDLETLYAQASVVIAPLRLGAGVKFKVLEAMSRAIPIVTTSVGAEGIGDADFTPEVSDSAADFSSAVITAMKDPARARRNASRAQRWMTDRYGRAQFERSIAAIYGVADPTDGPGISAAAAVASVVIPVRNGELGIGNALAALARQPEAPRLEVIISDNGSSDRTIDAAEAYRAAFADLRVVDSSDRAGVSHARNVGIEAAGTEKVLICDHDDEVRAGWVAALTDGLERADVVGGRAVSHRISGAARALESEQDGSAPLRTVFGYLPYVLGGCMGVRRNAALAVGGFDEAFLRGHEEADFCWRLQRAGYTIDSAPDAVLDYRQRNRALDAARQRYHSSRTRILLWTRYESTGELGPVSFRGSVRQAVLSLRTAPSLLRPGSRFAASRTIGAAWGTLDGHLRYRVLGKPPAPIVRVLPRSGTP